MAWHRRGDPVRVVPEDDTCFAVSTAEEHAEIEIRVRLDRWGRSEATALLQRHGGSSPIMLDRVFRAHDRRLTVGKMSA